MRISFEALRKIIETQDEYREQLTTYRFGDRDMPVDPPKMTKSNQRDHPTSPRQRGGR